MPRRPQAKTSEGTPDGVVLVVTEPNEGAEFVTAWLDSRGQRHATLYLSQCSDGSHGFTFRLSLAELQGRLSVESGEIVNLRDIKSVWYRRPKGLRHFNPANYDIKSFIERQVSVAMWSLFTTLPAFWVNPPLYGSRLLEENKLYQLNAAASVGLTVPTTLISNEVDALLAFSRQEGGYLAIKPVAGAFFESASGEILTAYTTRLSTDELQRYAADIPVTPVIAQSYIEKAHEVRVTVVGRAVLACEILSQDHDLAIHDWRRAPSEELVYRVVDLPRAIVEKLRRFMSRCQLSFAAIDMIVTPKGDYVFLEANPSGQYLWLEHYAALPISRAIADALIRCS